MDHYPVKDGMKILVYLERPDRLAAIFASFREEVVRLAANQGRVVIPEVVIRGSRTSLVFRDVPVNPHGVRNDVFQSGVVTALDVLLSLGELGMLSGLRLTWHGEVESYYVDLAVGTEFVAEAVSPCVFVYDVGTKILPEFQPSHAHTAGQIHFPPDLQVLVSPEYITPRGQRGD